MCVSIRINLQKKHFCYATDTCVLIIYVSILKLGGHIICVFLRVIMTLKQMSQPQVWAISFLLFPLWWTSGREGCLQNFRWSRSSWRRTPRRGYRTFATGSQWMFWTYYAQYLPSSSSLSELEKFLWIFPKMQWQIQGVPGKGAHSLG